MRKRMGMRLIAALMTCVMLPMAAGGEYIPETPTREVFSVGLAQLAHRMRAGGTTAFAVRLAPDSMAEATEDTLPIWQGLFGAMTLEGEVACTETGGWTELTLRAGDEAVLSLGQAADGAETALRMDDTWRRVDADAVSRVGLGEAGEALRTLDYRALREGEIPFLTLALDSAQTLWAMSSPWAEDTNGLRVTSGATGHALKYALDTDAARAVLTGWLDEMGDRLDAGLCERLRGLAETIEITSTFKMTMTFGENDLLRSAKGSGTVRVNGKKSDISFSYTCSPSNTRLTRQYSVRFTPQFSDTLSLSAEYITSSNGSGRAARELSLSASGQFGGVPYRVKWSSEMLNRYAESGGALTETLTGTVIGSYQYDGEQLAEFRLTREGACVTEGGEATLRDAYTGWIKSRGEKVLTGTIAYTLAPGEAREAPDVLGAERVDTSVSKDVGAMRMALRMMLTRAKSGLLDALPEETTEALLGLY